MLALKTENLTVSYSGVEAINDISLEIDIGEFVCIVGPNGGGKTTFLKAVLGILRLDKGSVVFNENQEYKKISYVPQISSIDRSFPITVLETVLTAFLKKGLNPFKRFSNEERKEALLALSTVGLENFADRKTESLSGGEFQRLLIARALASNPKILILDEPTASVDFLSRNKIFEVLKQLNQNGTTVIVVTHDLEAAKEYATKLISINHNLIFCEKPPKDGNLNRFLYGDSGGDKKK